MILLYPNRTGVAEEVPLIIMIALERNRSIAEKARFVPPWCFLRSAGKADPLCAGSLLLHPQIRIGCFFCHLSCIPLHTPTGLFSGDMSLDKDIESKSSSCCKVLDRFAGDGISLTWIPSK